MRKDVDYINKIFQDEILSFEKSILIVNGNNLDRIYRYREKIIKTCESIQVLKAAINPLITSLEQAKLQLKTSVASIRRRIKQVNQYLDQISLSISITPLVIEGDEGTVRSWATLFLLRYILPEELVIYRQPLNEIKNIIDSFMIHDVQSSFHLSPKIVVYTIFINYLRYLGGFKVKQGHIRPLSKSTAGLIQSFIKRKMPLCTDSADEIYYNLLYPYLEEQYCLKRKEVFSAQHEELTHYLRGLILAIQDKFNISLPQNLALYQHLINTYYYSRFKMFLPEYSEEIIEYMEKIFPSFISFIRQYLIAKPFRSRINARYKKQMICTLILHWPQLYRHLLESLSPIKVLFIPVVSYQYSQWLADQIKFEISRHLEVEIFSSPFADDQEIDFSQYDLVISQFKSVDINHSKIIHIWTELTIEDLKRILCYIQEIKCQQQERRWQHAVLFN